MNKRKTPVKQIVLSPEALRVLGAMRVKNASQYIEDAMWLRPDFSARAESLGIRQPPPRTIGRPRKAGVAD